MAYDKRNFKSGTKLYDKQLNAMDDQLADNEDRLDVYVQAINNIIDKANTSSRMYGKNETTYYDFPKSDKLIITVASA